MAKSTESTNKSSPKDYDPMEILTDSFPKKKFPAFMERDHSQSILLHSFDPMEILSASSDSKFVVLSSVCLKSVEKAPSKLKALISTACSNPMEKVGSKFEAVNINDFLDKPQYSLLETVRSLSLSLG